MTQACQCKCHVYGTECDIDDGSSGVPGVRYCGTHTIAQDDVPSCVLGHPEPVPARYGYLCSMHYNRIGQVLTQITELAALQPYLNPVGGTGQMGAKTIHSPAPGNLYTAALTDPRAANNGDDIPNPAEALYGWARMVEEENQAPLRTGTIAGMCNYLHTHRHWIARQYWVDDYALDLDHLHRALARGAGDTMWPRPIGNCPNCGRPLHVTIGIDAITCHRCKTTWEGVELLRLRLILEQEAK